MKLVTCYGSPTLTRSFRRMKQDT